MKSCTKGDGIEALQLLLANLLDLVPLHDVVPYLQRAAAAQASVQGGRALNFHVVDVVIACSIRRACICVGAVRGALEDDGRPLLAGISEAACNNSEGMPPASVPTLAAYS